MSVRIPLRYTKELYTTELSSTGEMCSRSLYGANAIFLNVDMTADILSRCVPHILAVFYKNFENVISFNFHIIFLINCNKETAKTLKLTD
jgi:hypothetical protein